MLVKALHIILSLSVLFSTTGFTLNKHFCQRELQSVGVFVQTESCQHSEKAPCHSASQSCGSHQDKEENGCCNNTAKYYKLDQDKQVPSIGFDLLKKPALFAAILVVFQVGFPSAEAYFSTYQIYKPPIVCHDFQSMLQTYRL
ncbi:MAG: hypothetical protein HY842_09310 [Bacteroidetes bacterium]|nr:hypothetical protein [Bacteroidota bacterium]